MKAKFIISFLFIILLFAGCSKDESPTQPASNPYSGNWQIVFAGSYTGGGTMSIGSDGKFSVAVLLNDGTNNFTNTITGAVSNSGSMSADIYYSGSKIGTASGSFTSNSGSGSWTTSSTNDTWAATKN